eukprot:gene5577-6940_t
MTFDEMHAVVKTAHNHKLKVTGHCRATEGIKNALRAGYDCIEHGTFMDDEAMDLLLERDVPCVPALYFEKASILRGPEFGLSQSVIDGHQETLDGGSASALRILRAGGRIGLGGDYGFGWNPHGDYAREITFFVKDVGFTPLEAIKCATKTGAEIMGRADEFGTVEPGKLADVIIIDHDATNMIPLFDVYSALVYAAGPKDVRTTIIHGRVIMEDRKILTLDAAEVRTHMRDITTRINTALAGGL